jgi:hypothetical protein
MPGEESASPDPRRHMGISINIFGPFEPRIKANFSRRDQDKRGLLFEIGTQIWNENPRKTFHRWYFGL